MMVRPNEPQTTDRDERLGEAIEAYLTLAETGAAPDAEAYADRHPELREDLIAALEGLALVQGLVGDSGNPVGSPGGRLESGRRIAGYKIVRELGRGGMGVVYEAVHVALDRPVALKVLGTHAAPDSSGRRRFLNEARTAAGLHHTHIVPVFDVGQVGGLCYYAMQRIEGSGLDRVVRHLRRDRTTAAGTGSGLGGMSAFSILGRVGNVVSPISIWNRSAIRGNGNGKAAATHTAPAGTATIAGETGSWPATAAHPLSLSASASAALSGAALSNDGMATYTSSGIPSAPRLDREDELPPFEPPRGSAYYRWVADVGRQAADALAHAHRRGVIHRDIKPSNLLIDGRGIVWVADFGLARRLADPGQSQHGTLIGTPRYMSPEQALLGTVDGRSDLYSLGATLYELLALRPPFEGRSAAELADQIGHHDPPPLRQLDARLPRDLEMIVLKLLAKRPVDRYASATDLAADLRRFLNLEPVSARRLSPVGRLWRLARRRPGMTAVTTVAAAAVLAVSIYAHVSVLRALDHARAALRKELWSEARVVRTSNMPNRRVTGLGLIKEAAALKPEADLRAKLRDEAGEFLVLRDVEARASVATGPARGVAYGPDGTHLATLGSGVDGETFDLWDLTHNQRIDSKPLHGRATASPAAEGGPPPPDARPGPGPGSGPGADTGPAGTSPPGPPPAGTGKGARPGPGQSAPRGGGGRAMGGAGAIATAGPCLAVITPDAHGVRLFDAITGGRIDELHLPGHFIVGLYATPDGQRLITVEDVFLAHWGDFRPGWGLGMGPGPAGPTPNPNTAPAQGQGRTAAATERYRVNLWDIARIDKAARPLATLMTVENETNGWTLPPLVAVSPDSHTIATASRFKTAVTLWSAATGAALPGGPIETSVELTALALGPGDQLAAAGNGEIRLWEVDSRLPMPSLPTTQGFVRMLRFSPRRPLLAVLGGTGREVELWDTADTAVHSLIAVLPTSEMVSDLAFAPDGRTIAAVGRSPMTSIWTVVEGEIRTRLGGFDALTRTMAFRSDGLLALGSLKGTIRFWNAGQLVSSSPAADVTPEEDPAKAITTAMERPATGTTDDAANRDRPVVLTFDDHGRLVTLERDALRICPAPPQCTDGQLIRFPSGSDRNGPMFFVPLAASSDGQTLVINHGQQLYLWHSSAPEKLVRLQPPTDLLTARERDRENDRPRNKRERGGGLGGGGGGPGGGGGRNRPGFGAMPFLFGPMAVTPRGDRVYVVEGPGSVLAWAVDGEKATSLSWSGQIADATSLALSPDGTRLAIGGRSGIVTVVGTTSGEVRARLQPESEGAPGWVGSMAFAPSGRELAVGNQQGQVELWSLSSASTPLLRLPGHRGSVAALAFDTQGNHLAAAGSDKTVDVWNLERLRDELSRLGLGW